MRFTTLTVSLLLLAATTLRAQDAYSGHIAPTPPRTPAEEAKQFHLPPGFEVQLVAVEPDIHKPMNLAFDHHGRLWVTDTLEYPFPAAPGKKPRDTLKILADLGPDGRARKITTAADGLNIPIGVLPLTRPDGDALVFSIPQILRLHDADGDGHADRRKVLYGTFGFRDTHGLTSAFTWGFDGWVYACHGFANTSTVKGADGRAITMNSGNVYRMKTDGSHVEQFTHGQVNPFGLSFDPLGNLYTCDCHSKPIYQVLRGAYYPSFGKPHDGLGFGPEMLSTYRGSTAIAGIVYYAADAFPKVYRGQAFVGDVVTNEIVLFRLKWNGSSPRATTETFLKSDDPWFRPVDIELGPDGALYVADFYNRIIGHYEVPLTHPGRDRYRGRIWRIIYTGKGTATPAPSYLDPSHPTKKAPTTDELVRDLGHPNLAVRTQATNLLVARGKAVADAVRGAMKESDGQGAQWRRAHGLWVLERLGVTGDALAAAVKDRDRLVRVHAMRVLSERAKLTDQEHVWLLAGLKDPDPHVRRAAADALGQHPAAENVRPLLDLRHAVPGGDTHLLHVVRLALREQLRPTENWAKLPLDRWSARDLDAVADVALGVPSERASEFLLERLREAPRPGILSPYAHHIARYGSQEAAAQLLTFARERDKKAPLAALAVLRSLWQGTQERGAGLSKEAGAWARDFTGRLLASDKPGEVQASIELSGEMRLRSAEDRLTALASSRATPEGQRRSALEALLAIDANRHVPLAARVLADDRSPMPLREQAANLLAQTNRPAAREELAKALQVAPARLQSVLAAGLAGTREGGERLLKAVQEGKASARLLQEPPVALRLDRAGIPKVKARLKALTKGLLPADQALREMLLARRRGFAKAKVDVARGKKAFVTHCAACHQVAGEGMKVGPQLDGIGVRGLDRLLEDVLDPNRNVDQTFRATTLSLKDGRVLTGLLHKEEGEVLVLVDATGKEMRVPKKAVDEQFRSSLSPMPADWGMKIPEPEMYDLLAYLLAQRPKR